jgi:hypothetical protein
LIYIKNYLIEQTTNIVLGKVYVQILADAIKGTMWAQLLVSNSVAETVVYLAELKALERVGSKVSARDT